jgi:hypothetical protein
VTEEELEEVYQNLADEIDRSEMYTVDQVIEWLRGK